MMCFLLRKKHIEQIYDEYDKIFDELLLHDDVIFYHFNIDINGGACIIKEYLVVELVLNILQ